METKRKDEFRIFFSSRMNENELLLIEIMIVKTV